MKRIKRFLFYLFLFLILFLLQISFLPGLGFPWQKLNLILSTLIFITVILSHKKAIGGAVMMGALWDLYSPFPYSMITVALVLTIFITNFFFNNFFTNRSLYSLLFLGLVSTLLYNFTVKLFNQILYLIKISDSFIVWNKIYLYHLLWQIGLNLVFLFFLFMIFYLISKRLRSYFVYSSKS